MNPPFIKRALKEGGSRSVEEFKEELNSFLTIEGVSAESETVIDVLAEQGVVSVRGSNLYAIEAITM